MKPSALTLSCIAGPLLAVGFALGAQAADAPPGAAPAQAAQGAVTDVGAGSAPAAGKPAGEAVKSGASSAGTKNAGGAAKAASGDRAPKKKTVKSGNERKTARAKPERARSTAPAKDKPASVPAGTAAATAVAVAAGAAAATGAAVAGEPAVQSRPALVVDGAAAPAPEARGPEIEVRVSATQQRENTYRSAVNLLNEGRLEESDRLLRQILAEHPGHDSARQARIGIALKRQRFAEAEALADDRLEHGAEHLGFAVVSARLKLDRGDPAAALDVLKRSDPHARSNPDYQALTAAVLQRLSRHAEAAERFRAALALQPGSGVWLLGLGVSLQALERPAEAADAYKRARDAANLSPELRAFVDQRMTELRR